MTAKLKWHGEKVKKGVRTLAAERLLNATKKLQKLARQAFGEHYPPASVPGQFPKRRTGNLVRSIQIIPDNVSEIVRRQLSVGLGYGPRAPYGPILEDYRKRLGLAEVVRKNRALLVAALQEPTSVRASA